MLLFNASLIRASSTLKTHFPLDRSSLMEFSLSLIVMAKRRSMFRNEQQTRLCSSWKSKRIMVGDHQSTRALSVSSPKEPPPPEPEWSEQQTDVIHLTEENFKSTLKKKKSALLFFYAPCTSMTSDEHFSDTCSIRVWALQASEASVYQRCCSIERQSKSTTKKNSSHPVLISAYRLLIVLLIARRLKLCAKNTESKGIQPSNISALESSSLTTKAEERWENEGCRLPHHCVALCIQEEAFVEFMKDPEEQLKKAKAPPPATDPIEFWKDSAPGYENVHMLTSNTFDTIVGASRKALVMFYAPWCGHCKTAKPAFASVATKLATQHKVNSIPRVTHRIHVRLRLNCT